MSIMKDYMDKTMEGVEEINLKLNGKNDHIYYLVLKNVDNGFGTRLDFENRKRTMEMFLSFSNLLGMIPAYEFIEIENENAIIVYLNREQILFMIERVENFRIKIGTKTFIRELKFLLDGIDPEI